MSAWRPANVNGFTLDPSVTEVFELTEIQFEELKMAWARLRDSTSQVDAESAVVVNIPMEAIRQGIEGAVSYQGIFVPGREKSWEGIKNQFGSDLERIMGAERAGLFRSSADYVVRLLTGDFGRYPRFFRITALGSSATLPYAFEVYGGLVAYEYANLNLLDWGGADGTAILSALLHSKVPGRSVEYSSEVPAYMAGMVELSRDQKP